MCTGAEILAFAGDMALSWGIGEIGDKLGVPWLDDVASVLGFGFDDVAKLAGTSIPSIGSAIGFDDLLSQGDDIFRMGTGFLDDLYKGADDILGGGLSNIFGDTGMLSGVGNFVDDVIHDPAKLAKTIAGGYIGNDLGGIPGALIGAGIGSGSVPLLNNPTVQKLANTAGMGYIGNQIGGVPGAIIGAGYGAGYGGQPLANVAKGVLTDIGLGGVANTVGNLFGGGSQTGTGAGIMGNQPMIINQGGMQNPFGQQQTYQPIAANYQGPGFASEQMISVPISTIQDILKKKEA